MLLLLPLLPLLPTDLVRQSSHYFTLDQLQSTSLTFCWSRVFLRGSCWQDCVLPFLCRMLKTCCRLQLLPPPIQILEHQTDMRRCRFDTLGKSPPAHRAGAPTARGRRVSPRLVCESDILIATGGGSPTARGHFVLPPTGGWMSGSAHRQIQPSPASSSCDFLQSQFFVTYTHTGRKIKNTHLQ